MLEFKLGSTRPNLSFIISRIVNWIMYFDCAGGHNGCINIYPVSSQVSIQIVKLGREGRGLFWNVGRGVWL